MNTRRVNRGTPAQASAPDFLEQWEADLRSSQGSQFSTPPGGAIPLLQPMFDEEERRLIENDPSADQDDEEEMGDEDEEEQEEEEEEQSPTPPPVQRKRGRPRKDGA